MCFKKMQISIIIPVYKAEKYINRCVDSILAQTFTDWELLLINDGSPDNSSSICDLYAARDSRIKVFHKENGGVSSARNLGLEKATGEWITFVDSDDWIAPDTLMSCRKYFDHYDIVRFSMKMVYDKNDETKNKSIILPHRTDKDVILGATLARNSLMCVCGGFYRTQLFKEIRFDQSLVMAEDWLVIIQLLLEAKMAIDIPDIYYYYNQLNESSCCNTPSIGKVENCLQAIQHATQLKNLDVKKYVHDIDGASCIIWKAMLRALYIYDRKHLLTRIHDLKRKYDCPSIHGIIKSNTSIFNKVICLCVACI